MNEADRDLLMLLGSVGIRVGEIVTGLFEDSLSYGHTTLPALMSDKLPCARIRQFVVLAFLLFIRSSGFR